MKKILLAAALLAIFASCERNDQHITYSELPNAAQKFVELYFGDEEISYVTEDPSVIGRSYDVYFTNGYKIEFDRHGEWTEVSCEPDCLPTGIVMNAIQAYVDQHFAANCIVEINHEHSNYEVSLNNDLDLVFNRKGEFKHID